MKRILNKREIDKFLFDVAQNGMTAISIKGVPSPGDTCSPIGNNINIGWECVETKERCYIIYE